MTEENRAGFPRQNYFYNSPGENTNVAPVIYESEPPKSSVGWDQRAHGFFETLGDPRNPMGTPKRNAEQEYLLQGMVKGAMFAAANIARKYRCGIAVRPTGVLAHMGIESGNPTKAQEFKNKTSKELDLFLCDELQWQDIGAVVHYNPRAFWRSQDAAADARAGFRRTPRPATEQDWQRKRLYIVASRLPALESQNLRGRMQFWPGSEGDWRKLKDLFMARAKEYDEEDWEYRSGYYKPYVHLEGPYVRLKLRPKANMVGDHDLFGFTQGDTGRLMPDDTLTAVQVALQESLDFQAQHGGIWYWQPREPFHLDIKNRIMLAHSAPNGEPLIHILPSITMATGNSVRAAFYNPLEERLESVWDHPEATRWLSQTFSGMSL